MNLLFLSTDFKPNTGGIAEVAHQLCTGLVERGHGVTVLAHPPADGAEVQDQAGFRIVRSLPRSQLTGGKLSRFIARQQWKRIARRELTGLIEETRPQLIFAGNYHAAWPGILPPLGLPYFVFFHGEDVARSAGSPVPGRRAGVHKTLSRAAGTFWNSRFSRSLGEEVCGGALANATVVGCGYPPEKILSEPDRDGARRRLGWQDEPVVVTVGRIIERKGIGTTLRALTEVRKTYPDCRYVVVGDGPERANFERLAAELGLADHVQFLGFVDEATKRDALQAADVFVMPSTSGRYGAVEGFGIVYLEANAHGLPVVGSTEGGVPDAVGDGENGMLVDPRRPDEVAHAIGTLLGDSERRRQMAAAGQRRIREQFNWPAITDVVEARLEERIERK